MISTSSLEPRRKHCLLQEEKSMTTYLGITINYDEPRKVKFTMIDYLEDILSEMPSDMNGTAKTPARDNLFTIDDSSPLLNVKDADFYHRTTARLLFAAKRPRPDLQVAVAYMYTE
jgi:hypothetical protein